MARSKQKRSKKETKESESTVIHFIDYINAYDVAEILIKKIEGMCMQSREMAHIVAEGDFDVASLASFIDANIDHEALNEFMYSDIGQGLILGLYISQVSQDALHQSIAEAEGHES